MSGNPVFESTFMGCTALTSINLPKISILWPNSFSGCDNITTVICNNASNIQTFCKTHSKVTNIFVPNIEWIEPEAFMSCTKLKSVLLSVCSSIGYGAFVDCHNLMSIYMFSQYCVKLQSKK